jgi:hypothetical protein
MKITSYFKKGFVQTGENSALPQGDGRVVGCLPALHGNGCHGNMQSGFGSWSGKLFVAAAALGGRFTYTRTHHGILLSG